MARASDAGRGLVAVALSAKPDLVQPLDELGWVADPDRGGGVRDLADDDVADGVGPGGFFERRRVRLRDPVEVVLARDVLAGRRAHRRPGRLVPGQELERGRERPRLALV